MPDQGHIAQSAAQKRLQAISSQLSSIASSDSDSSGVAVSSSGLPTSSQSTSTSRTKPPSSSMAAAKEPITCHILDTTTGTPAAGVKVQLRQIPFASSLSSSSSSSSSSPPASSSSPAAVFTALTNDDGRVVKWLAAAGTSAGSLSELMSTFAAGEAVAWQLAFETGAHFAAKGVVPFFPRVDISFVTGGPGQEARAHYHVPLLVGPFTYTTYRGS